MQNVRELIEVINPTKENKLKLPYLKIDETKINIYEYDTEPLPDWEPNTEIKPYDQVTKLYFDIETEGLKPQEGHRVVCIGTIDHNGNIKIFDCKSKRQNPLSRSDADYSEMMGLLEFFKYLNETKPEIFAHFNGFTFDIDFIYKRSKILGIECPFFRAENVTTFRTAQRFNKPTVYNAFWYDYGKTAIIDLYHQSLAWDFVHRELTRFGLKYVPVQLGIVDKEPIELSYQEMLDCYARWENGGRKEIYKYLVSDLLLTKALGEYLIPDIYYQKLILPDWKLQSISTSGNGTKWNDILIKAYAKAYGATEDAIRALFTADGKHNFVGGLVGAKAGLFRFVSKIDVASLYPTIQLLFGICSSKDTLRLSLSILKYLRTERLRQKAIASDKKGTKEGKAANQLQGALKILINSGYGFLGTQGLIFNDYYAACLVTAYGRAILRRMIALCEEAGGTAVSWDTDGLYYASDSFEKNIEIYQYIQDGMPKGLTFDYEELKPNPTIPPNKPSKTTGVELEYELEALAFYVPPASATAKNINTTTDLVDDGMRKNYIIIHRGQNKKLKKEPFEMTLKGKYRKRDRCLLEKNFIPTLVKLYAKDTSEPKRHFQQLLAQFDEKSIDVSLLSITRKIKANEKRLVELGLGMHEDVITIYKAPDVPIIGKRGLPLKEVEVMWTSEQSEIDWNYYREMLITMWKEFSNCTKN